MTSDILGFTNTITTENPQIHLILNIFDTDAVSEKRYKTLIEEHSENKNLEVYLSDTQKSSVHSILRNYPLYNNLKPDSNKINILVVGMGEFGYKFIGNMFGSCHFLNKNGKPVKLCVTAIDKQADIQRDRMLMDSPGFISTLESEGHLSIFNCDAETSAFRRLLDETEDFDYCIISTENDETNIRIAKFLKRYFIRKIIHNNTMPQNNDELFHMIPPLVVKIRDGKKSEFVFAGREDDMLIPFGSIETTYDYNRLSTNDITGFAIRLYAINCNSDEKMLTESYDELTAKFDKHVNKDKLPSKYDIDSTNEEAICLRYLIHGCTHPDREIMLRYIADPTCKDSVTDSGYYFREENSDELEALVCLLHERWRYYTLYSGFSCPSAEDYKVYEEYNKKLGLSSVHKFVPAFYNNLLKPAEELQKKSPCDYIKIKLMTYITKP